MWCLKRGRIMKVDMAKSHPRSFKRSSGIACIMCAVLLGAICLNSERSWTRTYMATILKPPAPSYTNASSVVRNLAAKSTKGIEVNVDVSQTTMRMVYTTTANSLHSEEYLIDYTSNKSMTSADKSIYELVNIPIKGQMLHFLIHAADVQGRPQKSGGDLWFVTASSIDRQFFTSGRVFDHQNGSYSVHMFAGWNDTAIIRVKLIFTGHATNFLENVVWIHSSPRVYWSAHFVEGNKTESSFCHIETFSWNDSICAYPRPVAMGNHTAFVCNKPPTLPCDSLNDYLVHSRRTSKALQNIGKGHMWLFNGSMKFAKNGIPIVMLKSGKEDNHISALKHCLPDEPNPLSHGYWFMRKWTSLVCKTRQWSQIEAGQCLSNKYVLLLGDSTTRQWYYSLVALLGENSKLKGVELVVKTKSIHKYNATVFWHFHPWTIGSYRKYIVNLRYEVDILDELSVKNCSKYIVVVSPWAHFSQWDKRSYSERLQLLKSSIRRLQTRCPGVPVVVRGPHPRYDETEPPTTLLKCADYMLYKMNSIMRNTFQGIGVHYLDIWDMNLAYPVNKTVHMPTTVIQQEIAMFLSYVCNRES